MTIAEFQAHILNGIPTQLPPPPVYDTTLNHAPIRNLF